MRASLHKEGKIIIKLKDVGRKIMYVEKFKGENVIFLI